MMTMFFEDFPNLLDYCNTLPGNLCVLGDFNLHCDVKEKSSTAKFMNLLDSYDLRQTTSEPTQRSGHILDLVIERPDDQVLLSTAVSDALESDHKCVISSFDIRPPTPKPVYRQFRNLRAMDRAAFQEDLQSELSSLTDPAADQLDAALRTVLDKHAPVQKGKVSSRKPSPWFSLLGNDVLQAKQARRKAERRWRSTGLTVFKDLYKRAKNYVTFLVHKAKCSFFSNKIITAQSPKELFHITNPLTAKTKSTQLPSIFPTSDLPTLFSDFFNDKIVNIRKGLDSLPHSSASPFPDKPFTGTPLTSFLSVTQDTLRKIISSSAPKTCELDSLPTPLLCEFLDDILPLLTDIVNKSLTSGSFPEIFKTAVVKPLLKKPSLDPNDLKNYRPVSNLSFISKIIEKIVLSQLSAHLSSNNLWNPFQSAYRPGHSTETALLKVLNDLLLSLDKGNVSVVALLDLSAAFDTIDHSLLLKRLENVFGVCDTALSWFSSYLSNRTQIVSVDNVHSSSVPVRFGVPQGSVLGPVLFVLYTASLTDVIESHSVLHHCYADDSQLQISAPPHHVDELVQTIQACICDVKSWMTGNKLKLNDDKTELMIVSSPRMSNAVPFPESMSVGASTIQFSDKVRNLGVTIDCHLSMSAQVTSVVRAANYELRRISSIRQFLTVQATRVLVSAFVLSKLDYCNSLLAGCPKYLIQKLQKVQNSAARLILKLPKGDHVSEHLMSLHWLPVESRIKHKLSCICFTAVSQATPTYLNNLVTLYTPGRSLRSSSDERKLCVPYVSTKSFGERSFFYSAPSIWNSLPNHLRCSESLESFKSALKTHFFKENYGDC